METEILAASVDSRQDAEKMVQAEGLSYPVAYGVDAEEVSQLTGAFYQAEKNFLHATGFLFNRKGTIKVAVYSTGPIGRFTAEDCLGLIKHFQKQDEAE